MQTHKHKYRYVFISKYVFVCGYTHASAPTYINRCIYENVYVNMYICKYIYAHTYKYACIYIK